MNTKIRRRLSLMAFLLALIGVVALILFKGPLAPVHVEVAQVERGQVQARLFGIGTVEALRRYQLGPSRSGRLLHLFVEEGDRVSQGQLLGEMDPVDLTKRLQAAQHTVDKARQAIEAARFRLADVAARLELAKTEARRYLELGRQKQVSQDQVDLKQTTALSLREQHHAAQADLEASRLELKRAQAEYDAIAAQLQDLRLLSPTDGLVVARRVEPGSVVMAGTAVLEIIDPNSLWVRVRMDQKGSAQLYTGLPAIIHLRREPDVPLPARVARLEWIADSLTEERWIDVAFEHIPKNLALGSLANVDVLLPAQTDVPWIPAAALHHREGQLGVWVFERGQAHFRPIEIGIRGDAGRVAIRHGLAIGETVITYSRHALHDGQKVEVRAK